ncbi:hypothetical protein Tco_1457819 [Tanacetum coccineum]
MAMMRDVAPSTYILAPRSETPPSGTPPLLPIPLPTSSPPLLLPSTDYKADVPECSSAPTARPTGGFRADYGFVGTLDAKIRRDPDREIGYGITDAWVDPDEIAEEIPVIDVAELGQRMTNFVMTVRMDNLNLTMDEYIRLEEEKACKRRKVFNWKTATYGKIRVDDDFYDLRSMEAEFLTIVVNGDFAP